MALYLNGKKVLDSPIVRGDATFRDNILLDGGNAVKSNSATPIVLQVTNGALDGGSLGSVELPVKTDAGAPNDAQGGDRDGCGVVNTNENKLYFRSGGSWVGVGLA